MNLQDTAVEFSAGVYDLSYDGLAVSTFDYSLVSPYNWVILRVLVGTQAEYTIFKPSVSTNGVGINLPLTQKDVYAEIMRNGSNFEFSLKKKNDNTLDTTTATMKAWGIKLDGIDASDISYNNETVESALDSLLVPAYITATHEALQTEITATNSFEINDETGDVIKITGNEPTNLVVNGDFSNGTTDWYFTQTYASWIVENGTLKGSITTAGGTATDINIYKSFASLTPVVGKTYYVSFKVKSNVNTAKCYFEFGKQNVTYTTVNTSWQRCSSAYTADNSGIYLRFYFSGNYDVGNIYYLDDVLLYDIEEFKNKGIKNDNGVLFANLTNEEIKSQLDIWVENGFPTVVEKLVSKSDNLFNAKFNTLSSLDSEDLVTNSDLLLDDNSDSTPNGFELQGTATINSLSNGIWNLSSTGGFRGIKVSGLTLSANTSYYIYGYYKTSNIYIQINPEIVSRHSGNGTFELVSGVYSGASSSAYILDKRTDASASIDWEVDKFGVINIADLVSRGILPSGLTNLQYKDILDNALYTNVPLRESDFISVEPSVAID